MLLSTVITLFALELFVAMSSGRIHRQVAVWTISIMNWHFMTGQQKKRLNTSAICSTFSIFSNCRNVTVRSHWFCGIMFTRQSYMDHTNKSNAFEILTNRTVQLNCWMQDWTSYDYACYRFWSGHSRTENIIDLDDNVDFRPLSLATEDSIT